jgi:NADH-quinone oxidoreductase subunit N
MMSSVFVALAPMLLVTVGGLALMLAEIFGNRAREDSGPSSDLAFGSFMALFAGAVAAIALTLLGPEQLGAAASLAPYLIIDRFTLFFCFLLCTGGALTALLAGGYLPEHRIDRGEFYPLLLFATVGAMALGAAGDLLTLLVGLETMSLAVYAMIGLRRGSARAVEAALKYFLLGSFATALLLYGGALVYGTTGHTDFAGIAEALRTAPPSGANAAMLLAALALLIAGLGFKIAAVPFHMWTPDAYEGAPTPTTTFMAVAVKSAAVAITLRVLVGAFGDPASMSWAAGWPPVVALLAVLTMTVANLVAGRQESVKRMLAYSSIAHAGYLLVGVVSLGKEGNDALGSVLFYLLAYTVSTAGAFGALVLCGSRGKEAVSYDDLAGLGRRHPALALAFSLFLFSLAGVPATAGFFAKLYVVRAALGAGLNALAILVVLNSVLAAYYYLRVLVTMYMQLPVKGAPVAQPMRSGHVIAVLLLCAVAVLWLGLWPSTGLRFAIDAALTLK